VVAVWIVIAVVVVAALASTVAVRVRRGRSQIDSPVIAPPTAAPRVSPGPTTVDPPAEAVYEEPAPSSGVDLEVAVEVPANLEDRLGKTRSAFSALRSLRRQSDVDTTGLEDLRETLLGADVGVETTESLLSALRERLGRRASGTALLDALRGELLDLLGDGDRDLHRSEDAELTTVWLFVGVNGVGKTTTIGKVARQQASAGHSVLLAAGDTFRAAAGEQLRLWAERSGADIVQGAEGSDPSAIVFDAVKRASARGNDLVLADTAGRFHNRVNLIEELKKIRRVADRPPGGVAEVLLVLDATTGQNGVVQAREFAAAVGVTGIVLTKLDGTAKGGVVLAVQRELGLPVKLVGVGEGVDDLLAFEPAAFVDALLGA
jgi:fused signal recognition particle receptor